MEWKTVKLGDILNFRRGHDLPHSEMKDGEIPVAGSNGCIGYHNVATPIEPVITIGRSGNVGMPYYYERAWAHNTTLYIDDFKGNNPKYLYYLIKTLPLASFGGGSAVPTLNRNHIHPLEILHVEDKKAQDKIVAILSSLDAKIENNNRINANLEAQAQALYKSWFVDFEPWGGKMPEDWKEYELGDFLPVKTGKKDANIASKIGTYPFFSCAQDILYTDNYSFDGNAILVAGNGDFNVKWYRGKFEAYQRTYVLIPDDTRYLGWLFYAVKHNLGKITSGARGSVIKFITKGNLENFAFVAPKDLENCEIIDKFNIINENIEQNQKESQRLAALRDALLPKLMKGEIEL